MTNFYSFARSVAHRSWLMAGLLLLAAPVAHAQAPGWGGANAGSLTQNSGTSLIQGMTTDGGGNVYVTGSFTGSVAFGSTTLTSAGQNDLFVAKYVPATNTWAWAQSGGGAGSDFGTSIAVSGTSVYVAGDLNNNRANGSAVLFGGTGPATGTTAVYGASTATSDDMLLLKYTDNGSSATLRWTQVGGGNGIDYTYGLAVSGSSVYLTGVFFNSATNANAAVFGGSGATAGTAQVNGVAASSSYDMLLAKYTDQGATATLGWTQVAGGTDSDYGYGVAASGSSVYLTGNVTNTKANAKDVRFGGGGTTPGTVQVNGASTLVSADLILAKYTDQGTSATLGWTQVGGGTGYDYGYGLAVSGTTVYVASGIYNSTANNSAVLFGGSGTTIGTVQVNGATATPSYDLLLAKYTDNGSSAAYVWSQVGGGTGSDQGYGVAVSGSSVYLTGLLFNTTGNGNGALFGGGGTTTGTFPVAGASATASNDVLLAKYTDQGSSATLAWAQVGGGTGNDRGQVVAVSGQQVYVTGLATPVATFGPTTLTTPVGNSLALLARLTDPTLTPLATHPAASSGPAGLALYPNPTSHGTATLTGAGAGARVQVLDALGRLVATTVADATGTAALANLAPGFYLVRAGTGAVRLSVE